MRPVFIVTDETITVVVGSTPYVIAVGQPRWGPLLEAITAEDWEKVVHITTEVEQLRDSTLVSEGELEVRDGRIFWRGNQFNGYLVNTILRMIREQEDYQPLLNFLRRLQQNPSHRVVQGLFRWVEAGEMKITPDGLIVAFKKVREDYTDCYSGKVDNSVGARPWKERNEIHDEPEETCAESGLHFCSKNYLDRYRTTTTWKDRIMVIHVDPADVVSFPKSDEHKGRACTYRVVDEIRREDDPELYLAAGLRVGSTLVVETTKAPAPPPRPPEDDTIGADLWAKLPDHDKQTLLLTLADVEKELSTEGPNLIARIRAAEKELDLDPAVERLSAWLWVPRED